MPLLLRSSNHWVNIAKMPVSYKVNEKGKMRDARNVFTIDNVLETRHGISKVNSTALDNDPTSITWFKTTSGSAKILVKDGTKLRELATSGPHTDIKTGLTAGNKHRAVSVNGRHIIAVENDGLFAWDGTTFTRLGQSVPSAPSVAASGTGNTLTASSYQVANTFYASSIGFETNRGAASSTIAVGAAQQIDVSSIASSAANGFIDKVRTYYKDVTNNGAWLFWNEIDLGTTTETIDDDPSSTKTPPTKNGEPFSNGAKYLAKLGTKLVVGGNATFPGEIRLSESNLPDAFDDNDDSRIVIRANGDGGITGIGSGQFNYGNLAGTPYIAIFTENSIDLYSEPGGASIFSNIEDTVGCVAPDTIKTINGDIYFMSTRGWMRIVNGSIDKKDKRPVTLSDRDMDDIFKRDGYVYELNKANMSDFFSVYYSDLENYMTFVSEGSNSNIYKAYNYEFEIGGFRPFEWPTTYFTCGCVGKVSNEDIVYLGGQGGFVYSHSINESRSDVDADGNAQTIDVFAQLYWYSGNDLDASYNFGPLILKALAQNEPIEAKYFLNQSVISPFSQDFDLSAAQNGFILDQSKLDVGILGDDRSIAQFGGEVLKTANSLLIGFYQNVADGNIGLLEVQLDVNKNGNPN